MRLRSNSISTIARGAACQKDHQMSGRGGRGRGRGRGAVPPSVAASSAYNYANNSTSSLGSSSSAGPAGLVGLRTEPTQKFPVKMKILFAGALNPVLGHYSA
jgi:hypothetical protein